MKKIFLVIAIAAFSFASAQDKDILTFWVKPIKPTPKTNSLEQPKTFLLTPSQVLIDSSRLLLTLPDGNNVYALPQDNMPCVVPDISQYNYNMPVLKPSLTPYIILNPLYPPQNKLEPFSPDKLKELDLLNKRLNK